MMGSKGKGSSSSVAAPPPPSASSSSRKVCIICCFMPGFVYYVYIVDVGADVGDGLSLIPKHPTLRLEGFKGSAFWVLNSTLYMFDGCDDDYDSTKSVRKLELDLKRSDLVLKKSGIDEHAEKLAEMVQSKSDPIAVGSPDGKKILVFSVEARRLNLDWGYMYDFELFDVETESWKTLPGILSHGNVELIGGYGFVTDSIFLAQVGLAVLFLDVGLPHPKPWEAYRFGVGITSHAGPFLVIEEEIFITHCVAYDMVRRSSLQGYVPFHFKMPSFGAAAAHVCLDTCSKSITPLTHVKGEHCTFCILSVASATLGGDPTYPLAMDVYTCDIARYTLLKHKFGDDACPTPTILKNLKYALRADLNGTFDFITVLPME